MYLKVSSASHKPLRMTTPGWEADVQPSGAAPGGPLREGQPNAVWAASRRAQSAGQSLVKSPGLATPRRGARPKYHAATAVAELVPADWDVSPDIEATLRRETLPRTGPRGGPLLSSFRRPELRHTCDSAFMASTKLVILGGSGFVGLAVAEEALRRGLRVLCLSRSGGSTAPLGAWKDGLTWAKADALQPETYREHLVDADALVVAIGSPPLPFVDRAFQLRMNGETNVSAARTAKEAGVKQLVLINASMPPALTPRGYYDGKVQAEKAARELTSTAFGTAVLKPAAIFGTRYVGKLPVPLWPIMAPASAIMRRLPVASLAANAPVSVRNVAAAAVDAATDAKLRGRHTVWENVELFTHLPRST